MYIYIFTEQIFLTRPNVHSACYSGHKHKLLQTGFPLVPSSEHLTHVSSQTSWASHVSCTLTSPRGTSPPWICSSARPLFWRLSTLWLLTSKPDDEPVPLLVPNPAPLQYLPTLMLKDATNQQPGLMHCTYGLIDPWGQATPIWQLRHGWPLPSPATCSATLSSAEGSLLCCQGAQWQPRHGRVGFCPLSFVEVLCFLNGLFNLRAQLVRAR